MLALSFTGFDPKLTSVALILAGGVLEELMRNSSE